MEGPAQAGPFDFLLSSCLKSGYSSQTPNRAVSHHAFVRTKRYYVYIIASKSRTIYVGMTGFLMSRVLSHKASEGGAFTRKYRVNRLVYYEIFQHVETAIHRETEIKKWRREKKVTLIERNNPTWEDLAIDWGKPIPMTFRPIRRTKS